MQTGALLYGSRGINQHMNSTQSNRVLMFLAAITGNWGRPGGAYFNMSASLPIDLQIPEDKIADIKNQIEDKSGWLDKSYP